MNQRLLFPVLFSSLLFASCTNDIAKYPPDWAPVSKEQNAECINFSGIYINKAIEAPTNQDKALHTKYPSLSVYLSELLVPFIPSRQYFEHKWVDTIELKGIDNGTLKITLWEKDKQIFQTTLNNKSDFSCTSQYLVLTDTSNPENMMGVTERFEKTKFSKGVDGSILVSEQKTDVGLFALVPYGEKTLQRYKFLPAGSLK